MAAPGFLDSISPWGSRSTTPKPNQSKVDTSPKIGFNKQQGADHAVTRRNRPSLRDYPEDCPKPMVKWFYAVDVENPKFYACRLDQFSLMMVHSFRKGSLFR